MNIFDSIQAGTYEPPKRQLSDETRYMLAKQIPSIPDYALVGTYDTSIIEDYKAHFPELDTFIKLLVAARFSTDRRQCFFWMKAVSD